MVSPTQPAAPLRGHIARHLSSASPLHRSHLLRHLIRAAIVKLIAVALIYSFFF
jgi:hypothetical protein